MCNPVQLLQTRNRFSYTTSIAIWNLYELNSDPSSEPDCLSRALILFHKLVLHILYGSARSRLELCRNGENTPSVAPLKHHVPTVFKFETEPYALLEHRKGHK
jgi:hypothetical protein